MPRVENTGGPATVYVGIDPGASGGIAQISPAGIVLDVTPATAADFYAVVGRAAAAARDNGGGFAVLESNTGYVGDEGNTGASMFKFGRQHGLAEMALAAAGLPHDLVQPQVWQKALGVPRRRKGKGKAGETKAQFKNRLKALAQRLFPGAEVTLKTCDALLIAEYARRKHEGRL